MSKSRQYVYFNVLASGTLVRADSRGNLTLGDDKKPIACNLMIQELLHPLAVSKVDTVNILELDQTNIVVISNIHTMDTTTRRTWIDDEEKFKGTCKRISIVEKSSGDMVYSQTMDTDRILPLSENRYLMALPNTWQQYQFQNSHLIPIPTGNLYASLPKKIIFNQDTNKIFNFSGSMPGVFLFGRLTVYDPENFNLIQTIAIKYNLIVNDHRLEDLVAINDKLYALIKLEEVSAVTDHTKRRIYCIDIQKKTAELYAELKEENPRLLNFKGMLSIANTKKNGTEVICYSEINKGKVLATYQLPKNIVLRVTPDQKLVGCDLTSGAITFFPDILTPAKETRRTLHCMPKDVVNIALGYAYGGLFKESGKETSQSASKTSEQENNKAIRSPGD